LEQTGEKPHGIEGLRRNTANYLLQHKDDFIAYFDQEIANSAEKFEAYCQEISNTAAWGGQIEVRTNYSTA
jgi:OTU domain-containing protein 6